MVMMRRANGDVFARESVGIAGTIEEFVVVQNHKADARELRERLEEPCGERHVGLHGVPFFGIERAVLVEDVFGDADFADIVEDGGQTNFLDFGFGQTERFSEQSSVGGNLLGVALGVLILGIDGVGEGSDGVENRLGKRGRAVHGGGSRSFGKPGETR